MPSPSVAQVASLSQMLSSHVVARNPSSMGRHLGGRAAQNMSGAGSDHLPGSGVDMALPRGGLVPLQLAILNRGDMLSGPGRTTTGAGPTVQTMTTATATMSQSQIDQGECAEFHLLVLFLVVVAVPHLVPGLSISWQAVSLGRHKLLGPVELQPRPGVQSSLHPLCRIDLRS